MSVFIISGVPGAGKTTVVEKSLETLKEKGRNDFKVVNFGSLMTDYYMKKGWIKNRDEIRLLLSQDQVLEGQLEVTKQLKRESSHIILDTHLALPSPTGYFMGFPLEILKLIDPHAIILVEADPVEIASRRSGDNTRKRDYPFDEMVREYMALERNIAAAMAVQVNCRIKLINNPQGRVVEAALSLSETLEGVS